MKKSQIFIAVIAAVLLLTSPGLYAQEKSGSVSGYVKDDAGVGLPGATITATSDIMPGVRTSVSDANGYYRLPNLIPGKYQVVAGLTGFNSVKRPNIVVNVGAVLRLDFTMGASTVNEEVTVTASAPAIEPEKTTIDSVITNEVLNTLPILGRDFMSSLRILPGVVQAGGFMSISGGRDTDKNYNIDGMDNVDIAQGKALSGGGYSLPTDKSLQKFDQEAIQELSVARGGYGADVGWGSAGVINVVTKSGSNKYHGSLYLDFRNNKLDFDNPTAYESYYFGGSFSGPLIKDKLLFFASVSPNYRSDAYDRRSWWMQDVPENLRQKGSGISGFLKLTWLVGEKHTLNLSTNTYATKSMRNLTLYRYPGDYPEENNYYDNASVNASLTSVFSEKFLLDSRLLFVYNDNRRRNPPGTHAGTLFDFTQGIHFTGTYGDHDWNKVKFNWTETGNIFVDDFAGRHTITTGVEIRYNKQTDERVYQEGGYIYPGYQVKQIQNAFKWSNAQTYYAAYISDKWSPVKNLVLQPGIRVSNNSYLSQFLIEPRLNISFDPFGDGKTVIRAGANIYRDRINDYVQQLENYPLITTQYKFGDLEWEEPQTYRNYVHNPNLTFPTTTEFTIGIDREIFKGVTATASYIYRNYKDQLFSRTVNLLDRTTGLRDDPTKGSLQSLDNSGYCKYNGIQLTLGKALGQGWYQFLASFTYQTSKGNSFLFLDFAQHQGVLSPQYKDDMQPSDLYGLTVYDKPYDFKIFGSVKLPLGFLVSGVFNVTAGSPYTAYTYDPPTYEHPHFTSAYQALRSPQTKNIDIRAEKDFRISHKYNIRFKLEVFNLFNWENVYEVLADSSDPDFGMPYDIGPTRRIQIGFRMDF